MTRLLLLVIVLAAGAAASSAQVVTGPHGVTVTPAGIVRVDAWTCYRPVDPTQPPMAARLCPDRIEIGADVAATTRICRTTATGQTCIALSKVFGQ